MSLRACLLLFLLLVPAFNMLAVYALPTVINRVVMHRMSQQGLAGAQVPSDDPVVRARQALIRERGGVNVALPSPRPDADLRTVVRLSPDLLYTACVFDLRERPLRVRAPVPEGYVSVSGFASDTSNFFAFNDRDAQTGADGRRQLDLLLFHGSPPSPPPAGVRAIAAPSARGVVLFRLLIDDDTRVDELRAHYQALQSCDPA
jgi:uncharacterized membrane protein